MDVYRVFPRSRRRVAATIGLVTAAVVLSVSTSLALGLVPTKGPIPPAALKAEGIDKTLVPDFISALDRNGQHAGYVSRDDALPEGTPVDTQIPVFDDDLKTIVGYMHPDRGFVPLGTDPEKIPLIPMVVRSE